MADLSAPVKGEGGLLAQLDRAVDELRRVIRHLDADVLTGAEAERLMRPLAAGRNVCDAGLATLAARVEQTGRWKQVGAPTPGVHLGSLTGGSAGSGNKLLGASRHLEAAPEAKRALGEGTLSLDQAAEIAGAVAETAGSPSPEVASRAADVEAHLLEVAAVGNLATLRRESDRARQAARDEADVRRRQHQSRYLRRRRFGDGSVGAELKLPALVGGQVLAVLDKLTERRFNEQRAAGCASHARPTPPTRSAAVWASPRRWTPTIPGMGRHPAPTRNRTCALTRPATRRTPTRNGTFASNEIRAVRLRCGLS